LQRSHVLLERLEHQCSFLIALGACASEPDVCAYVVAGEAVSETIEVELPNRKQGLRMAALSSPPTPVESFCIIARDADGFAVHDAQPVLRLSLPTLGSLRVAACVYQ
jgi:hypothetical protein